MQQCSSFSCYSFLIMDRFLAANCYYSLRALRWLHIFSHNLSWNSISFSWNPQFLRWACWLWSKAIRSLISSSWWSLLIAPSIPHRNSFILITQRFLLWSSTALQFTQWNPLPASKTSSTTHDNPWDTRNSCSSSSSNQIHLVSFPQLIPTVSFLPSILW